MKRSSFASLVRRATVPIAAALALAACSSGREPAGPTTPLSYNVVRHGPLALWANIGMPTGRDTLVVTVSVRTMSAAPVALHTTQCPVSVRLLAAAPGEAASATFYDDFQRPCTRALVIVPLAPGAVHRFHHPVPLDKISRAAPRAMQAQIGVLVGDESGMETVLLTGYRLTLP